MRQSRQATLRKAMRLIDALVQGDPITAKALAAKADLGLHTVYLWLKDINAVFPGKLMSTSKQPKGYWLE